MGDEQLNARDVNEDLAAADAYARPAPTSIGQPLVLSCANVDPPPFLDVLSFHSSRLLPVSRKELEARELHLRKSNGSPSYCSSNKKIGRTNSAVLSPEEEAYRLDELLASVHLLLEPIQLPDLSHTGVFDQSTSLLRPVTPSVPASKPEGEKAATKLKLSKLDKSDEVKLFYPTGAKNSNMRDYIKETIQKHFSAADLNEKVPKGQGLGVSASAPIFHSPVKTSEVDGQIRSTSPSKTRTFSKATKKKSKLNAIKSPVKASLTTGALLNPQLTRQAKDIIAAVRANSSKINELISK
ncbi:unnamed protein product [Phytophthora lilii]|uniref:Unnamed protein product n=1 Tax=Phytophthora lilii TaxID=2077276 RepID=A0A9W6TX02_9STRA|nr:unnamed protein product [Phytophthora lilii]